MSNILILQLLLLLLLNAFPFKSYYKLSDPNYKAPEEHWYNAPLDHFDLNNSKTIPIRYYINDTFYDKDKNQPLFVQLGGEGTETGSVFTNGRRMICIYAQEFGGLMLDIEHRFYGKSVPEGGLSDENLGYLSTIQALEDFSAVIYKIKNDYGIKGPVITIGGSYSGSLSAWMRQKYPNLVYLAHSSSAPILATTEFTQFMDVIANDMGDDCSKAAKKGFDAIDNYLENNMQYIIDNFKPCKEMTNDFDKTIFIQQITANLVQFSQYNGTHHYSKTIEEVCQSYFLNDTLSDIEKMVEFVKFTFEEFKMTCSPSNYNETIKRMKDPSTEEQGNVLASTRSWAWQICTEYSYFQPILDTQPFDKKLSNDFYYSNCQDFFNVSKDLLDKRVKHTNVMFGGMKPKTNRVMYVSGTSDPWMPLSKIELLKSDVDCYNRLIKGTSHCADLYTPDETDPEDLVETRKELIEFVRYQLEKYETIA